ncbi:DUF1579 family protein [Rhodopirellula sp. JC639]|uniref:DUF1579 family protein n=1 Tax=Stieleria mannarensis TaxID=2755585 RepID=UPI0016034B98|nr:DUF1579 family protein [Rhodopirellula sp. JC639]
MKVLVLMAAFCLTASCALAQDEAPSKEHAYLAKTVGTRTGTMKVWPQGPDGDAMEFPFSETNTAILGGNWVESAFEAGPYKGRGMSGYDPIKKKYIGTWANNMTPYLAVMEGTYDEAKHELTMIFDDIDPATNKPVKMKSVFTDVAGEPSTMTMYQKNNESDAWVKTFVLTYKSKQK